ncbi:hypothetical protein CY34DRAFT_587743 [Suillus luteus UH-Slu-Lm8-n1]|uniref:Uncharacterized protein n=1 Tax=Suillus luteus UH-Slu-Lm8-n1 TaxID=930992 RepID=A0A0C9ZCW7_9AGAM|nr:hypothetical protein CY34DRAFT_587743 [Suillus luteus UH-Slu-Lm8-n1]
MLANVGFLFLFHIQKGGVGYVGGVKEDAIQKSVRPESVKFFCFLTEREKFKPTLYRSAQVPVKDVVRSATPLTMEFFLYRFDNPLT